MTPRQARLAAARAKADEVRRQLDIDDAAPIDVFEAIRQTGVWLVFHPMDGVLGVTLRQGPGGILINPERPLGMQRFTAAHELGHWYLHDEVALDSEDAVTMGGTDIHEAEAHAFASAFLMPRRLVNRLLRHYGLTRHSPIEAVTAYQIARDLGVSYTALLVELRHLGAITRAQHDTLTRVRVAELKRRLTHSTISGSQVWTAGTDELTELDITVGDTIALSLEENATTGYRWMLDTDPEVGLAVIEDHLELPDEAGIGGGGTRRILLSAQQEGRQQQHLQLRRTWDAEGPSADTRTIVAYVAPTPAEFNRRVLAPPLPAA